MVEWRETEGVAQASPNLQHRRDVLVGRAAELAVLEEAVRAVRDEQSLRTVTLIGAAGVGKTRIVRDFLSKQQMAASAQEGFVAPRVFRGSAREGGGAYEVFARVLRARFGIVEGMAEEAAKNLLRSHVSGVLEDRKVGDVCFFLGQLMDLEFPDSPLLRAVRSDPIQMRLLRRAVIKRFLEADAAASQSPIILVFDDLHHAHDESLDLLSFLIDTVEAPVLLLCLARPEMLARYEWGKTVRPSVKAPPLDVEPPRGGRARLDRHVMIELAPLSEADSEAVMRALLAPCGDADIDELVFSACTLASGNPALLERMVRIFHDMGVLEAADAFSEVESWTVHVDKIDQAKLPLTVEDAIQARIAALAPKERELLERAAVMGSVFWLGGLLAMVRIDETAPNVWTFEAPRDRVGDPVRDAVNDEASLRATLRDLRERDYVLMLPDSAFPDDEEFAFKHNLERETLLRLLPKHQTKRFHEAVADWLSFKPSVRLHEESMGQLAHHERNAGRLVQAVTAYFDAGHLARDRYANAKASEYYEKGVELLEGGAFVSSRELLTALHHYGDVLQALGKNDAALAMFKKLLAHAYKWNLPSKGGAAHSRMGRFFRDEGRLAEAQTHLEAALALFEGAKDERGVASTIDDLGRLFRLRGEYARALEATSKALELRRAMGDRRSIAVSLNNLGLVHRDSGELERAAEAFEHALALRREIGDLVGVSTTLVDLGVVVQDRGDDTRAKELFSEALEVAKETGDRHRLVVALCRLGETECRLGEREHALAKLRQAEELAADIDYRPGMGHAARGLGKAYLALHDYPKARAFAQHAVDVFRELEDRVELGLSHRTLGEIMAVASQDAEGIAEARSQLLQSIWILDEAGRGLEFARSCAVYATLLRTSGDDPKTRREAEQFDKRAAEIFARASAPARTKN